MSMSQPSESTIPARSPRSDRTTCDRVSEEGDGRPSSGVDAERRPPTDVQLRRAAPMEAGGKHAMLGGGAIGLGSALALKIFGATDIWIAETNGARHAVLNRAGDFKVYDPRTGAGPEANTVDLIIDGVGYAATREAATATVKSGGTIVHIGLGEATGGLDIRRMTLQEIGFIGTYSKKHHCGR